MFIYEFAGNFYSETISDIIYANNLIIYSLDVDLFSISVIISFAFYSGSKWNLFSFVIFYENFCGII